MAQYQWIVPPAPVMYPPTRASTSYPPGWQPPYQGPPPLPSGVNVAPQAWNSGYWQFNPAYNHRPAPAAPVQAPWAASQHWNAHAQQAQAQAQAQAQQGASFNPYKRVPRPPSAEYMASKLSDNPLGLSFPGGKTREDIDREREENGADQHTPWIWNPRGLVEDEEKEGTITADWRDDTGRRIAQEVRGPTPSRNPQKQIDPRYATRHSSEPPPAIYAPAAPAPVSSGSTPTRRASTSSEHRSQTTTPQRRHSDASSSAYATQRTPVPKPVPQEPETFTAKKELVTTFTSRIIRTPDHSRTPSRSGSTDPALIARMERLSTESANTAPLSRNATAPAGLQYSWKSPQRSSSSSSSTIYSSNSASSSMSDVQTLSEEPASILSPLMVGATPKQTSRTIGRGSSGSSSLSSIPETSSPLNPQIYATNPTPTPQSRSHSRGHSPNSVGPSSTASSRTHSPMRASPSRPSRRSSPAVTPPQASPQDPSFPYPNSHSHSAYQATRHSPLHPQSTGSSRSPASQDYRPPPPPTEPRSHSTPEPRAQHHHHHHHQHHQHEHQYQHQNPAQPRLSNPLPAPPADVRYPLPSLSPNKPAPASYSRRVRKGFWNRRGDHLTRDGYIVYVPQGHSYPDELKDYPSEQDGYRDELGTFAMFNKHRPELPESLPHHGQAPARPYETFLIYEYIP
ncbi:hypothetical protein HGRIS_000494 [Hohenbuehelia grisea]|uniref:Uncharacterized protein n=1 Tax=Hohenbuehelia grisea TaxID=104357 RepID=A0ABR3JRC8_9AGAR